MGERGGRWAVVLGAGDGTRLSSLTTRSGVALPKQFCLFNGGPSLLQLALRRADQVVPRQNTVAVLSSKHRQWWERDLEAHPQVTPIVQPANRGTAAGVLLPLLAVVDLDPRARVAILPSDHFFENESVVERELRRGFDAVQREPDSIVLLGITPDLPETGYGWIVPGPQTSGPLREVETFAEKPTHDAARALMARGGVWNSFLIVAEAATLLQLYEARLPELLAGMRRALSTRVTPEALAALEELYASLPVHDFSRDLMQGAEERLRMLTLPVCGWSDLGTPERVAACVEKLPVSVLSAQSPHLGPGRIDLVHALTAN